jgi:N-acetylneuraminic acid mutarotase
MQPQPISALPQPESAPPKNYGWVWVIVALVLLVGAGSYAGWRVWGRDAKPAAHQQLIPADWRVLQAEAPTPRTEVTAALYEGKIYVAGGFRADGTPVDTVEFFDPATEIWGTAPPLPAAVHHSTAVVYDGKLYVVGGLTGHHFKATANVFVYDGSVWRTAAVLPEPIGAHAAAVMNGRIYILGGVDATDSSTNKMYSFGATDSAWRAEPAMSAPRNHLAAAAIRGKLYAFGGRDGTSFTLSVVEMYNGATRTWSKVLDMPAGRSGIAAAVVQGNAYVFGGESTTKTYTEAEIFNPATQTWTAAPAMPSARHGLGAVATEDRIYLLLGGPQPGLTVSGNIQMLSFSRKQPPSNDMMEQ